MIAIVNYRAGNLRSVFNAFEAIGQDVRITDNEQTLKDANAIVVPGVGAFGECIQSLRDMGLVDVLEREVVEKGKPYLGICLGMQFLGDVSHELGVHKGFGWMKGEVKLIEPISERFKVPHIGWNDVDPTIGKMRSDKVMRTFDDLPEKPCFYFLHSYHLDVENKLLVTSLCYHGVEINASVEKDNIYGVQFHPEKSQKNGLQLLKNFVKVL